MKWWNKLHEIGDKLHLPNLPTWLVGFLVLIFLLRIPSFFEPYYYGDEMIYMTLGQGVKQGLTLYKDIHDNKPPLLYILATIAGSLFWFKAMLAAANIASIILFWKLAQHFFQKNLKTIIAATTIFGIITTIPLLEGNTVNSELFMLLTTMAAYLILLTKNLSFKNIYFAGILLGFSILLKVPSLFDVPVIVFFWFFTTDLKNWNQVFKNTIYLALGVLTPIVITFGWYFYWGALKEYFIAAYLQNIGYLSSWRAVNTPKVPFLTKNGPLLVRFGIAILGSVIVYWQRKKLSQRFIFFCLWTLFSLFAVSLSERPYPHYLIQSTPVIAFFVAILLTENSLEQSLTVLPLALIFLVPTYYKFWYYPTSTYYQRFVEFALGKITKEEYFQKFSSNTKRNYELANFINKSSLSGDRVFMWDNDSPTVYALSRRIPPIKYVADYHVNDYWDKEEMIKELTKTMPKFIVLTNKRPLPEIHSFLLQKYLLVATIQDSQVWSRIDFIAK